MTSAASRPTNATRIAPAAGGSPVPPRAPSSTSEQAHWSQSAASVWQRFTALAFQIEGLIGPRGIQPARALLDYLAASADDRGETGLACVERFWNTPTCIRESPASRTDYFFVAGASLDLEVRGLAVAPGLVYARALELFRTMPSQDQDKP